MDKIFPKLRIEKLSTFPYKFSIQNKRYVNVGKFRNFESMRDKDQWKTYVRGSEISEEDEDERASVCEDIENWKEITKY
jgi:hypothetical protein